MRRIVHLSDIHFGRVDSRVAERVIETVNDLAPDLVVVSGDLTQRAKSTEFRAASLFLRSLPTPQIVVPGNHDVPLYNVISRFRSPLRKFRQFITDDLTPWYADAEIAVLGVNTSRSLTVKAGRVNERQIDHVQEKMCGLSGDVLKIVVTHHPFDLPEESDRRAIVGRAGTAMKRMVDCGAEVFLSGHLHVSHVIDTARRYKLSSGRNALVVQAGTATSVRGRGEANSFNLISFDRPRLEVATMKCDNPAEGFVAAGSRAFIRAERGWIAEE